MTVRLRTWSSTTVCGGGDVTGDGLGDSIREMNGLGYLAEGGPQLAAGANLTSKERISRPRRRGG